MKKGQRDVRERDATRPRETSWLNRTLCWLEYACWAGGIAALGWYAFVRADTFYFQAVQARRFAAMKDRGVETASTPSKDMLGMLTIPRIGLSVAVLEGDSEKTLRRAVGHIPGTSLPGGPGTVGLAAHRDTFFRSLGGLRPNDEIVLETRSGNYRYRVAGTAIVEPASANVLQPQGRQALALVTCYPFDYIGPAPRRFVVTAWEISSGAKRPGEGGSAFAVEAASAR